jgi:exosortase/archaeosortase family protein
MSRSAAPISYGSGGTPVVGTPELAFLRRHIGGQQLARALNPALQVVTAAGATAVLRALDLPGVRRNVFIDLPTVSLEVQEWCSGLVSMKWLLALGVVVALGVVACTGVAGLPWAVLIVLAAPIIGLEINILRVATIGMGIERYGHAAKDAIGWGVLVFGITQIVWLGTLGTFSARRAILAG